MFYCQSPYSISVNLSQNDASTVSISETKNTAYCIHVTSVMKFTTHPHIQDTVFYILMMSIIKFAIYMHAFE